MDRDCPSAFSAIKATQAALAKGFDCMQVASSTRENGVLMKKGESFVTSSDLFLSPGGSGQFLLGGGSHRGGKWTYLFQGGPHYLSQHVWGEWLLPSPEGVQEPGSDPPFCGQVTRNCGGKGGNCLY